MRQQGSAILLFVSLVLLALLLLTLAAYKHHYFQQQKAYNHWQYRQLFWQAQGGLACLLALHRADPRMQLTELELSACQPANIELKLLADMVAKPEQNINAKLEQGIAATQTYEVRSIAENEQGLSVQITNILESQNSGDDGVLYFDWQTGRWRDY